MKKARRRGFMRQSARVVLLVLTLVLALQTAMTASAADNAPTAPSNLTVNDLGETSINLFWENDSSGETSIEIERKPSGGNWEVYVRDVENSGHYFDSQIIIGLTYTYRIRAVLTTIVSGTEVRTYSGYSNEASGTIDSLYAPVYLFATPNPNSISLRWTDNSDIEDGFMITKQWENGTKKDTFSVGANVTSYVDNDVIVGYSYTYDVVAWIDSNQQYGIPHIFSESSNTVTIVFTPSTNSFSHFVNTRPYTSGMFNDVDEDAWYGSRKEKAVASVYEKGLMAGYPDQTFKPDGNLSIAEAITIATRVNSIYTTGHQLEFDPIPDAPWYQGNINYAIEKGIIEAGVFSDYTSIATRGQMAYIFAHTLPNPDNTYSERFLQTPPYPPDVDESTPFYDEIVLLYRAGIVGGTDSLGTFHPNSNVTRAQAAAIITRLIDKDARLGDTWYYPGWTS